MNKGNGTKTENKSEDRVFLRPPLISLREAICFNPDVIQVMDLPLSAGDNEDRICEKLAINRDIVLDYDKWLVENKFRSSNRYKDGLPKFSAFMLLGVCHGDTAETYAEEASFMKRYCEVIGIPMAGLLVQKRGGLYIEDKQFDLSTQFLKISNNLFYRNSNLKCQICLKILKVE